MTTRLVCCLSMGLHANRHTHTYIRILYIYMYIVESSRSRWCHARIFSMNKSKCLLHWKMFILCLWLYPLAPRACTDEAAALPSAVASLCLLQLQLLLQHHDEHGHAQCKELYTRIHSVCVCVYSAPKQWKCDASSSAISLPGFHFARVVHDARSS